MLFIIAATHLQQHKRISKVNIGNLQKAIVFWILVTSKNF